ncbi:MAG TPA: hypothetical protein VL095_09915 [Flavisolibacter sp.]|nr:hypothetical protein [Flavisolibacter sp.]
MATIVKFEEIVSRREARVLNKNIEFDELSNYVMRISSLIQKLIIPLGDSDFKGANYKPKEEALKQIS